MGPFLGFMSWQNLSELLTDKCISTFSEGIEVHYFDKDAGEYLIEPNTGVYDSDYQLVDLQTGAPISSRAPMVEISQRNLQRPLTSKDKISARGILYKVRETQPDAAGAVKHLLSRS